MADVIPHFCTGTGCEALHGSPESEDVKIAKINADRDIRVAQLAHSDVHLETEAEVEQAEVIADAEVEQTAIQAEAIIETGLPDPEPEVPVVEAPVIVTEPEPEPEDTGAPPETEPAPREEKSAGWWAGYR
jgi:hypothetical protein